MWRLHGSSAQVRSLTTLCAASGGELSHIYRAAAGLAYDRNWMIVKEDKGKFVTQRQVAKYVNAHKRPRSDNVGLLFEGPVRCCRLALIATSIPQDALTQSSQSPPEGAVLTLEAPGMDKLQVQTCLRIKFVLSHVLEPIILCNATAVQFAHAAL